MKHLILLLLAALTFTASPLLAGQVNTVEIDELKTMLDTDNIVILDVRAGRDWSTSEFKIPGAIRADGNEYDTWSQTLARDKKIVLYCA